MPTYTFSELTSNLRRYLTGEMQLAELSNWVDGYEWRLEEASSPFSDALASVELSLHERADGSCSDEYLRATLQGMLDDLTYPVSSASAAVLSPAPECATVSHAIPKTFHRFFTRAEGFYVDVVDSTVPLVLP